MSLKELTHRNDKASSKQRSSKPTVKDTSPIAKQTPPTALVQRSRLDPKSLTSADTLQLQRTFGNRAIGKLLAGIIQHQPNEKENCNTGLLKDTEIQVESGGLSHLSQPTEGQPADRCSLQPEGRSSIIQRYIEVSFEDKQWRQSDSGEIVVESTGEPGYRSKNLYAKADRVARAQKEMEAAGSFIKLNPGAEYRGRVKVNPQFVGPGADEDKIYTHTTAPKSEGDNSSTPPKPVKLSGEQLTMSSDCNNSARVIMGFFTTL